MKLTIKTAELARALYRVQGIADKKSTMPILAQVLLNASEDGLAVSATDMDIGLSGSYTAEVKQTGMACLPARQLYEIVKALAGDSVELATEENNWLEIRSAASRFRLVAGDVGDFPALPTIANAKTFSLPAVSLNRLIEQTLFCVSTDDNRHNLSGVYCETSGAKTLRFVATDGHRLALAEQTFEHDVLIDRGVIVPRKCFQELRRVLGDVDGSDETVKLGFSGNSGVIHMGSMTLSTRLVEGQFPDYTQVIPSQSGQAITIPRVAFADSLRRVSLLSQTRAHGVRLSFTSDALELVAEDPEHGEAREQLTITYQGEPLTIGFNARYLLDVLALISEDHVIMELSDGLSPGVIKPAEHSGFLAVVMPMRI